MSEAAATGPASVRDEIDGIVAAWKRDGGVFARRATLVDRFKEWAEKREAANHARGTNSGYQAGYQDGGRAGYQDGYREGAMSAGGTERRRCSAIITQVAREIDEETAAKLADLPPGEQADNGVAVGAFRATREIYARVNGLAIDPETGKPVGMGAPTAQ